MICLGYLISIHHFYTFVNFPTIFFSCIRHKTSFMSTRDRLLRIFFCLDECLGDTALVASAGDTGRMRFVLLAELDDREESLAELLSVESNATLIAVTRE